MFPPFDIFFVDDNGELVWVDTAETLAKARMRVKTLRSHRRSDYVIYSQRTGHKSIVRGDESQGEHPICPTHDTFMVPHSFQPWELSLPQEKPEGFRCPNLDCPIVYIEVFGGFHSLVDGNLTQLRSET
jgi:hypothetical protein